jgi:hypothetical protein
MDEIDVENTKNDDEIDKTEYSKRKKLITLNVAFFIVGLILIIVSRYTMSISDIYLHYISQASLVIGIVICIISFLAAMRAYKIKE